MRKLRRAYQKNAEKRKRLRKRAIAAGTAAVITLGAGLSLNNALGARNPDRHHLAVPLDADADLLANAEELAIGYLPFNQDQNRNQIPDGVDLAKRCADVINELPEYDIVDSNYAPGTEPYKLAHFLRGIEHCNVCGQTYNMGGWIIVNPRLNLTYPDKAFLYAEIGFLPCIAVHCMEHGSFSYSGEINRGRPDLPQLLRTLELRYPHEPDEHQLPLDYTMEPVGQLAPDANDHDGDLLADSEELGADLNLYDADQDDNLTPDGIELAKHCKVALDSLPEYDSDNPPLLGIQRPYKFLHRTRGYETCEICGLTIVMNYWEVVNPRRGYLTIDVLPVMAAHYMEHGSFSYAATYHKGRINVPLLLDILEMPRRCGHLGTMYLPGDFNKDCKVDSKDFARFADKWLQNTSPDQGDSGGPRMTYHVEDCDPETYRAQTAQLSGGTRFSVTTEGIYIRFEDMMVANCCPEDVQVEMQIDGNRITIYETEYTPGGCWCICDYPVTATIGPLEAGTYTIEVYEDWGGFIGSTTVTIGPGDQ